MHQRLTQPGDCGALLLGPNRPRPPSPYTLELPPGSCWGVPSLTPHLLASKLSQGGGREGDKPSPSSSQARLCPLPRAPTHTGSGVHAWGVPHPAPRTPCPGSTGLRAVTVPVGSPVLRWGHTGLEECSTPGHQAPGLPVWEQLGTAGMGPGPGLGRANTSPLRQVPAWGWAGVRRHHLLSPRCREGGPGAGGHNPMSKPWLSWVKSSTWRCQITAWLGQAQGP